MKDCTDLGFVCGPHSLQTEKDSGEQVFQEKSGLVEGFIFSVNSRHELNYCSIAASFKSNIEKCTTAVGRIFSRYDSPNAEPKWWCGTGFCVNENSVLSAHHVVKPRHIENGNTYTLSEVYIYFGVNAKDGEEVSCNFIRTNADSYQLTLLTTLVDKYFPDKISTVGGTYTWEYLNDFAILTFKDKKPKDMCYLLPKYPFVESDKFFTIGYPGYISQPKFKEDYPQETTNIDGLYATVYRDTNQFEHLVVSVGIGTLKDKTLSTHRCPTLRGISGGILGTDKSGSYFVGVHIGGDKDMKNNFAISITYPAFVYAYFQHIVNDSFFQQHITDLHQYKSYYEKIKADHPNGGEWN
ncbi:hypothetical protein DLAC_08261 [Tieghemostelium lacteum]|uniref:Serine protease n=1 Tax=Tieghemostelium lacteum TaxID=361077 RepID=A0A151ZBQ5_TIELA|nr:hypothetical protein DLAC_08261 [Tieghemostelium lacteum]|eukprot:KYQ91314.1 hypothetical protein DLAC_08261 [Tieghemostelium lacteum]